MAFDHEDGTCLECEHGHAVERVNQRTGTRFYGCDQYPACKSTAPFESGHPFRGDGFLTGDEQLQCWAEAMLADKDWF